MSNDLFILDFILISASYNTTLLAREKGKKTVPDHDSEKIKL